MGLKSLHSVFWIFYLWMVPGSSLAGLQNKRSPGSPSLQLSNHTRSCPGCKAAPVFDRPLYNQTVTEGGRATFKCYVSGNPPPDVTWYRNGKPNGSRSFVLLKTSWGLRLRIREAKVSDAGGYICVANNSEGTVSMEAFLTVNETTVLPATPQSTWSSTPLPKEHNGSCVRYNGSVCLKLLKGVSIYVKSYDKLENIERKVSTAYDNIRTYEQISPRCRPFVRPLLCHYQFKSCDPSSAEPKAREICYEECEVLRKDICSKEYKISESQGLQGILFPVCSDLPRNGTKEGRNCIKLGVNEPLTQKLQKTDFKKAAPVFDRPLYNQTVTKGGRVTFKCYVSGNPPPDVAWYRNGKPIRSRSFVLLKTSWGSRLRIREAKVSDAGGYICVANNSEGTVSMEAFLTVNETTVLPATPQSTWSSTPLPKEHFVPEDPKQSNPQYRGSSEKQREQPTTSDLEIKTPSTFPDNGSCVRYNGSVCLKLLKGVSIYVKSYDKLENIERKVSTAYDNIRTYEQISPRCRPFVRPLLCHYQFKSCDPSSAEPKAREICYEECEVLRKDICAKEYKISEIEGLQEVLFPVCSDLPRSGTKEGRNCIKLGVNEPTIQKPQKTDFKKAVTGCYTGTGKDFHANVSVTEKGYACQAWNSTRPHFHILSPDDHPEIGGGHNFCRNPGGQKKRPWCFTTDDDVEFDYCDIPRCEDPPPVQVVSILYTVIPCLLFAIVFSSVVIFVCWRCHKQIMYQAAQSAATPLVPVVGKPSIKEMRRETVRFLKDLGEGEFGKLYKGEVVEKVDGVQTARPILAKVLRSSSSSSYRESFLRQAETWSKFSHPNVMTIIGVCYNGPPTCILYECVEYGTLRDYLVENCPLESPVEDDDDDPDTLTYCEQLSIAIQVAAGMNYLSQHNYIHGDIAARNCMVGPRMTVKITDVALSRNPFFNDYHRSGNRPPMPLRWMAPEGVLNYRFTVETDIWSFGVLLWEIFSFGARPHDRCTDEEVTERIREHVLLPCPSDCPNRVFVLMKECWDILPPSRPRFSTIYTHLCALRSDINGPSQSLESIERECFHVEV